MKRGRRPEKDRGRVTDKTRKPIIFRATNAEIDALHRAAEERGISVNAMAHRFMVLGMTHDAHIKEMLDAVEDSAG